MSNLTPVPAPPAGPAPMQNASADPPAGRSGHAVIQRLRGGLVASCQAGQDSPLNSPSIIAALAESAERGGAIGFRVDRPENVAAVRARSRLPIIGINKQPQPGFDVFITPTLGAAREVVDAGADLVAIDGTGRPRPGGESLADLIAGIHADLSVPVMADISTHEEGLAAVKAGADILATTLAPDTSHNGKTDGPALELAAALTASLPEVAVIVEGRIWTVEDIGACFHRGAHAVVVGSAITVPEFITRRLVAAIPGNPSARTASRERTAASTTNPNNNQAGRQFSGSPTLNAPTTASQPASAQSGSAAGSASDRFFDELMARLEALRHDEQASLGIAADHVAASMAAGKPIALYDTGHLVSHELVARTGGFVAFKRVEIPQAGSDDSKRLEHALAAGEVGKGSVLIIGSVSGTDPDTVDLAERAKARGATVIALTSPRHSGRLRPQHTTGLRLMDAADIVLDNHADYGDAFLTVAPMDRAIVPFSGFGAVTLAWALVAATTERLLARGIHPSVYRSIHLPDGAADVARIERRYLREGH